MPARGLEAGSAYSASDMLEIKKLKTEGEAGRGSACRAPQAEMLYAYYLFMGFSAS